MDKVELEKYLKNALNDAWVDASNCESVHMREHTLGRVTAYQEILNHLKGYK